MSRQTFSGLLNLRFKSRLILAPRRVKCKAFLGRRKEAKRETLQLCPLNSGGSKVGQLAIYIELN